MTVLQTLLVSCFLFLSLEATVTDNDLQNLFKFQSELEDKKYKISGLKDHVVILKDELEELNWRFVEGEKAGSKRDPNDHRIEKQADNLNEELENLAKESDKLLLDTDSFLRKMEKKMLNNPSFGQQVRLLLKPAKE